MKFKKLIAMALAFAMALTLAVPAFAADEFVVTEEPPIVTNVVTDVAEDEAEIEEETVPAVAAPVSLENAIAPFSARKGFSGEKIEGGEEEIFSQGNGAKFSVAGYSAIYVKQSTGGVIWVPELNVAEGQSREAAIKAIKDAAVASDNSMGVGGLDAITVIVGDPCQAGPLHDGATVVVASGYMTIKGVISHVAFPGAKKPSVTPVPTEPATISATLNIQKLIQSGDNQVAPTYESFKFEIKDEAGAVLGTVTTNKTTGLGNATVNVTPGKTYTIHEVLEGYQLNKYNTPDDKSVTIPADAVNGCTATVDFVNTLAGEGSTSSVLQITKFVNNAETKGMGFVFDIIPVNADGTEGNSIAVMFTDENGEASTEDFFVAPGKYIIRERLDEDRYMPVDDIVVTVDDAGKVTYATDAYGFEINSITNVEWASLDVLADVRYQYYEEYHKLVYKYYEYDTLVAGINPKTGNLALPAGMTGSYLKNGMTYLTIDKSVFEGGKEIELNIAQSNMTGGGKKGNTDKWNSPVVADKTFTLSLNDKGQLVVKSGLTADESTFGAKVYPMSATVRGPQDIKHDNQTTYDLPKGDTFKFFIHWENTSYTLGEIIGCELDHKDLHDEAFSGELTMTVTNDATDDVLYNGALGLVEKVAPGSYTVELFADGEKIGSMAQCVLEPGMNGVARFEEVVVWGEDVIVECPYVDNYGGCPIEGHEGEHGIFPDYPFYEVMPIAD